MSKKYPYDIYPIFETEEITPDPYLVSIIMPFNEEHNNNYKKFIKPVFNVLKFNNKKLKIKRADDISKPGKSIVSKVWNLILQSRFVIAELTDLNPNVFYELGIVDTLGKPVLMLWNVDKRKKPPFDVGDREILFYSLKKPDEFIKKIIDSIESLFNSTSSIHPTNVITLPELTEDQKKIKRLFNNLFEIVLEIYDSKKRFVVNDQRLSSFGEDIMIRLDMTHPSSYRFDILKYNLSIYIPFHPEKVVNKQQRAPLQVKESSGNIRDITSHKDIIIFFQDIVDYIEEHEEIKLDFDSTLIFTEKQLNRESLQEFIEAIEINNPYLMDNLMRTTKKYYLLQTENLIEKNTNKYYPNLWEIHIENYILAFDNKQLIIMDINLPGKPSWNLTHPNNNLDIKNGFLTKLKQNLTPY